MNLLDLLDRPIAFHRSFVTLTGHINAALMLSQAVYWSRRTNSGDGSFYKSRDEWADETGLTHEQQESARKRLRGMEFWVERNDRISHKVFYRIDLAKLRQCLSDIPVSRNRETRFRETVKDGFGKPCFTVSSNGTETTAETTAKTGFALSPDDGKTKTRKGSQSGTVEEVEAFAVEIGQPKADGTAMFWHFAEKGWGKNWQATVRKWKAFGYLPSQKTRNGKPVETDKYKKHL